LCNFLISGKYTRKAGR